MNARTSQSTAIANLTIARPQNSDGIALPLASERAKLAVVILVVLMILGLLLSGRSGGGWIGKASLKLE